MDTPDMSAFSRYIPGFDFLQNLSRQAAGNVATGMQSGVAGMPPLSQWVAPSFNPEELEKRITELRAVHFWLDQNAKALAATIQALEVQKMTLTALKGMNVSLQDVAEAFKIKPEHMQTAASPEPASNPFQAASVEPEPEPAAAQNDEPVQEAKDSGSGSQSAKPQVDPMQWWSALTEQFQTIATGAMQDMAGHAAKAAEQVAQSVQAGTQAAEKVKPQTEAVARKSRSSTAAKPVSAAKRARAAAKQDKPAMGKK